MIYIGLDPGKTGAMVALSERGEVLEYEPYPLIGGANGALDLDAIAEWVEDRGCAEDLRVTIEQVASRPGQGVASMFSFGRSLGGVEGIVAAMHLSRMHARPQAWQKVMLAGKPTGKKVKQSAIEVASALWPELGKALRDMPKKKREGVADAALIAEFGRRSWEVKP